MRPLGILIITLILLTGTVLAIESTGTLTVLVQTTNGGNNGGGGSSSSSSIPKCMEEWICGDWGECTEGNQTRECRDKNLCNSTVWQSVQNCTIPLKEESFNETINETPIITEEINQITNESSIIPETKQELYWQFPGFLLIFLIIGSIYAWRKGKNAGLQKTDDSIS